MQVLLSSCLCSGLILFVGICQGLGLLKLVRRVNSFFFEEPARDSLFVKWLDCRFILFIILLYLLGSVIKCDGKIHHVVLFVSSIIPSVLNKENSNKIDL